MGEFEIDRVFLLSGGGTSTNISDYKSCLHKKGERETSTNISVHKGGLHKKNGGKGKVRPMPIYQTTKVVFIQQIPNSSAIDRKL